MVALFVSILVGEYSGAGVTLRPAGGSASIGIARQGSISPERIVQSTAADIVLRAAHHSISFCPLAVSGMEEKVKSR